MNYAYYRFISPEGKKVTGVSLKAFAEKHGMHRVLVSRLKRGAMAVYKGWHAYTPISLAHLAKLQRFIIHLDSGEKVSLNCKQKDLYERYGFVHSHLSQLLSGKKIQYKGWVLDSTHRTIRGNEDVSHFSVLKKLKALDKCDGQANVMHDKITKNRSHNNVNEQNGSRGQESQRDSGCNGSPGGWVWEDEMQRAV